MKFLNFCKNKYKNIKYKRRILNKKKSNEIIIKKPVVHKKKNINLGIELLRMILSFLIVLVHNYSLKAKTILANISLKFLPYYVPSFFLIGLYFSYNIFSLRNIEKIKQRFIRILIPYMGWPIIFWLENNYKYGIKRDIKFKPLYQQLLIGCCSYGVFWFLFNLLFISILFVITILLFNKRFLFVLSIITIICYLFEYSKYEKIFFNRYNFYPVGHSIEPIPRSILYSFTGFVFGSVNLINKYYNFRIKILFIFGITLFIILFYDILHKVNLLYRGIVIDLGIISAFSFFSMIPFDKINNRFIFFILKIITSNTGGVYFLHPQVLGTILKEKKYKTFKGSIILYLTCYLICLVGATIFRRTRIKFLFN